MYNGTATIEDYLGKNTQEYKLEFIPTFMACMPSSQASYNNFLDGSAWN